MTERLVAWDTMVLIDAIEQDAANDWWRNVEPMCRDAEAGRLKIVISEISVAEACKIAKVQNADCDIDEAMRVLGDFLHNPFIERRPVGSRESRLAAEYIRDYGLETCDAVILATSVVHRAEALYTRDGKVLRKTQNKLIAIERPPIPVKVPNAAEYLGLSLYAASVPPQVQ